MTSEKLTNLIEKKKASLVQLKAKRAEIDEKIKKAEIELREYEMMENDRKFSDLATAVAQKGLSLEDVLSALQSGDLLALQEQMEARDGEKKAEEVKN